MAFDLQPFGKGVKQTAVALHTFLFKKREIKNSSTVRNVCTSELHCSIQRNLTFERNSAVAVSQMCRHYSMRQRQLTTHDIVGLPWIRRHGNGKLVSRTNPLRYQKRHKSRSLSTLFHTSSLPRTLEQDGVSCYHSTHYHHHRLMH